MELVHKNLVLPNNGKKLLLHTCCAPCSGSIILSIQGSGIDFTIFFYNPNIHPKKEYEIRKDENIRFAEKCGVPIVDAEYDTDNWYARAKGMEFEPERGSRCAMCFDMRMERTALYAHENGFDTIATSLGISRWKDLNQVNEAGNLLGLQLAQKRWFCLQYGNLQKREVLPTRVLWLCFFATRC